MDARELGDLDSCRTCGAAVASMSRHRAWHADVDKRIKDAENDARRARRGV